MKRGACAKKNSAFIYPASCSSSDMNKLSRKNLKDFCRTCLTSNYPTTTGSDTATYDLRLLPQLSKLMIRFTSLDVDEEQAVYPKCLCQCCYDKLLGYEEFRQLAQQSTETLFGIVNGDDGDKLNMVERETRASKRARIAAARGDEATPPAAVSADDCDENDDNDDSQLLLPEISLNYCEKFIKSEPIDIDTSRPQTPDTLLTQYKQEQPTDADNDDDEDDYELRPPKNEQEGVGIVKNEIDSEYDEDETGEADDGVERANCVFYENNALDTNYDFSMGDDADDEEYALRNGAANTSSNALNTHTSPHSSTSLRPRHHTAGSLAGGGGGMPKRGSGGYAKKSLKCPRCDKQVYKQVYLDAHIRGVHEGHEKPFLCIECDHAFTRYNQLHLHIQSQHQAELPLHACEFEGCEARFKKKKTLKTHFKVMHSDTFGIGLQDIFELHQAQLSTEIEMDHICQQCCKKYSSKRALSEHLKRHLQIKEHICKVCGVAKVTRTELQTHMRTHDANLEKFKCELCPQEFNHKNAISRHVRVVHEGLRRFPCHYCPKRFGTRNSAVCHERLHTGEKPYSCDLCVKSFAQVDGLKSHMKNHDKSLRKHVCSYCEKRFITRKNLIDHEQRHRSDKPHICHICSRGYFKQEDLLKHISTHTADEEAEANAEANANANATKDEMEDCSSGGGGEGGGGGSGSASQSSSSA